MTRSTFVLPGLLASTLALYALSTPVNAAVFCVDDATDLQAALTTATSNGEDDQIQIVQGTYVGGFIYDGAEAKALSLRGGYVTGCGQRDLDPANTILTGNGKEQVLTLWGAYQPDSEGAALVVEWLTLRNGLRTDGMGAGLLVAFPGSVHLKHNTIEQNVEGGGATIFLSRRDTAVLTGNLISGNTMSGNGGGLFIHASGTGMDTDGPVTITLSGNIIRGNHAGYMGGGAILNVSDNTVASVTLTNNTFVDNSANFGSALSLVLPGESGSSSSLYNNLFWRNSNSDLSIQRAIRSDALPSPVTLLHNNFDQTPGTGFYITPPIPIDPSNLDKVDPLFVDPENGDLSLLPGSPMIDAGDPGTPNLPSIDFAGQPRVIGGVVDIGAYEFDDGFIPGALLNSAVLPYARAVAIGDTATAFASVINSGNATATDCSIALPGGLPASFSYQTTNAANALIGIPNSPIDIAPGVTQGFVFGITPSQAMAATEIPLVFDCANTSPAPSHAGLNTFILSAAASAPPDLLAIGATPSGDGVVRLPDRNGTGFFATAAVNIGSAGSITVSADDGGRGLPLSLRVCETTPAGEWIVCGNNLTFRRRCPKRPITAFLPWHGQPSPSIRPAIDCSCASPRTGGGGCDEMSW